MAGTVQILMIVYGVLLIIGGVMGYVEAKSVISLIAGSITGLLELVAYALARTQPKTGFGLGLIVAILLIFSTLPRYLKSHKIMPSGLIILCSVVMTVLLIAALAKKGA